MTVFLAVAPVFLTILFGCALRYFNFLEDTFWRGAEKITYFILFPALLVSKMATANLSSMDFSKPITIVLLLYLSITAILLVCRPFLGLGNPQFTSVFQGGIRFNTYIGLSVVVALYNEATLVVAVLMASLMIPVINVLCVLVLEYFGNKKQTSPWRMIKSIALNPLILACAIGMGINILRIPIPGALMETLDVFSRAALPMGLLTVGAAFTFSSIWPTRWALLVASIAKFILLPLIAMSLCTVFEVNDLIRNSLLVLTVLPTATASYVLARQLGGDYSLMATIITAQTIMSAVLLPLLLDFWG